MSKAERYRAQLDWPNRDFNILVWSIIGRAAPSKQRKGHRLDVHWRCRVTERTTGAQGDARSRNFQVAIVVAMSFARRHAAAYYFFGITSKGDALDSHDPVP